MVHVAAAVIASAAHNVVVVKATTAFSLKN